MLILVHMKHVRDDWALQDNTVDTLNFPWSVFVQHTTLSNPRHHKALPNISHTSQTTKSLFFIPVYFFAFFVFFFGHIEKYSKALEFSPVGFTQMGDT